LLSPLSTTKMRDGEKYFSAYWTAAKVDKCMKTFILRQNIWRRSRPI
jgi:hypothetical protein